VGGEGGERIHQLIAKWLLFGHCPRLILGLPTNYGEDDASIYEYFKEKID
jgi:hypothetical protein